MMGVLRRTLEWLSRGGRRHRASRDGLEEVPVAAPPPLHLALEFEAAALLEEYKALQSQTTARLELQQQLHNYTVVLGAAVLPIAAAFSTTQLWALLLGVPLVAFVLGLLMLAHDRQIGLIAKYINLELAPRLQRLAGLTEERPLFTWEVLQVRRGGSSVGTAITWSLTAVSRYAVFPLPALIALAAFASLPDPTYQVSAVERALFAIDCLLIVGLVVARALSGPRSWAPIRERMRRRDASEERRQSLSLIGAVVVFVVGIVIPTAVTRVAVGPDEALTLALALGVAAVAAVFTSALRDWRNGCASSRR